MNWIRVGGGGRSHTKNIVDQTNIKTQKQKAQKNTKKNTKNTQKKQTANTNNPD